MSFPKKLLYSKDYVWVQNQKETAVLGVIDLAASESKEFVFINLPKKGDKVKKGDKLISLESMKWTGNLKSPLTGEVIDVNMKAYNEPSIVNSKPYETWLVKIKIKDAEELKDLMDNEKALKQYKINNKKIR